MNERLIKLKGIASKFRAAILACDLDSLALTFKAFPMGACGDAALLLGTYLHQLGYGPIDYVSGQKGVQSHGWPEMGDIIIDITADQFGKEIDPVLVTRDKTWHKNFGERMREYANLEDHHEHTQALLLPTYKQILRQLKDLERGVPDEKEGVG